MRLTNLADHLRSWGLEVVEFDGWKTRGADFPSKPHVVVAHHTGTPHSTTSDYPTKNVVINGRSDLPGPLCQVGLGYSGKVYVVAAGKANHAGKGHWAGHVVGNSDSVGIEAESPGDGSWTPQQRKAYPLLCAALCDLLGSPAGLVCGHRESAEPHGRKVDPAGIDLEGLRAETAAHLRNGKPRRQAGQNPYPTPVLGSRAYLGQGGNITPVEAKWVQWVCSADRTGRADADFGPMVAAAQKHLGLSPADGKVGKATLAAMAKVTH